MVQHHALTATQTVAAMLTVQPRPTRSPSTQAESALPQDPTKLVSQRINIPATVMQKGRVLSRPSPTHIRATPLASLPTGSRLGDRHDSPPADTKNQPFPSLHMRPALRPALVPCLLHFIQFNEDASVKLLRPTTVRSILTSCTD